jgi:hypothetical protein
MSRYTRRPSPYYDRALGNSRDRRKVWRLGRLANRQPALLYTNH